MNAKNKPSIEKADIIIIGAGAIGCSIARRLSRYKLHILLLEKADDVAAGASKANSGIIHGGYAAQAGSLKGELSARGNRMFDKLEEELKFGFKRTGSLVLAFEKNDLATLEKLLDNGVKNGVQALEILSSKETLSRYPSLNPDILAAFYCPETGITSPYEYTIALAENSIQNGVKLYLDTKVDSITQTDTLFRICSGDRTFQAPLIINCTGAASDDVAALVKAADFHIRPRKGQYLLCKRGSAAQLDIVVFQPPTEKGKGILVTPTVWGNLLIGPDAQDVDDSEDLGTDAATLAAILKTAEKSLPGINSSQVIRIFSGIRPCGDRGDFIIEESRVPGFFNLGGIESPGLTASPAIALMVEELLKKKGVPLKPKDTFQPCRKAIHRPGPLIDPKEAAIKAKLPYGDPERYVCRCEQVSEEIVKDAINRNIPIRSLDAVKRRTRAGMGLCQGSFCGTRVREYLIKELGVDSTKIIGPSRDRQEMKKILDEMRALLG